MTVGTRTISFSLDRKSIGMAIKEVQKYKKDFEAHVQKLVQELVNEGVIEAKIQVAFMSAIDTGTLQSSIHGFYDSSMRVGYIRTGVDYAAFVEYGTGVVGAGAPHPAPEGWAYDVNSHGESGWIYKSDRDGQFHWTKGMPSRPFMYNTYKYLQQIASRVAENVFEDL